MPLNSLQADKLQIILHDEHLLSAIYTVFNDIIEENRPDIHPGVDNALLGEKYRAYTEAKDLLNKAFRALEAQKVIKIDKEILNRAR